MRYGKATQAREQARAEDDGRFVTQRRDSRTPADLLVCGEGNERRARESRERAAKITGGSGRGVQQAKAVKRDAPDLYKKVLAGDVALDAADKERKKQPPSARRAAT